MQNFDPVLETRIIKTLTDRPELNLFGFLTIDHFGAPVVREIWERLAILKSAGKAFPSSQTLAFDPVLTENARVLLNGTVQAFEPREIDVAVDQLEAFRKHRHLFWMVSKVTDICKDQNPDHLEAQRVVETCLRSIQTSAREDERLSYGQENDKVLELYESLFDVQVSRKFIPTGFNVIDKQQGGLERGCLYTIGANSGGGKSLLSNCISINAYLGGFSVGYASFEMGREQCMLRTQANISRIPHDRFKLNKLSPEERQVSDQKLAEFLSHGEANGIRLDYLCPKADVNLAQFFGQVESLNYDVIVVDYINLMAPLDPKKDLWFNLGEAFRLAKRFAERNDCAVLMLVQIDEETKAIKYAKSIKHHSDGIWIWTMGDKEKQLGVVEIEQAKLRSFAPTKFHLKPELEYCVFTETYGSVLSQGMPDAMRPMKL